MIESSEQVAEMESLIEEIQALDFCIRLLNRWGDSSDMYNIVEYIKATCPDTTTDYTVLESRLRGPRSTICIKLLEPIVYVCL